MRRIVDINWSSFRTKFNGREREKFEELSYLLFCKEHGQDFGIFGYFNQTGIEKEPIEINGKLVGFQAKFFETRINENVREIMEGISKAKQENPELKVIYYYINKDFSESSIKGGKDPRYKVNIEAHASSKDIEIVWKTTGQLEIQLRHDDYLSIAEYYFELNQGLIDTLINIQAHKDAVLRQIKTKIVYSDKVLKIDRSKTIEEIIEELKPGSVQIIRGDGGVGKTAVVKELLSLCQPYVSYVFRANEFNVSSLHDFFTQWGTVTLRDFINEHRNDQCLVVIDSAEKLSDIEDQLPFYEFFEALLNAGWHVIFTTRNRYYEDLIYLLNERFTCNPSVTDVPLLAVEELQIFSSNYGFDLPSSNKLIDLIRTPYYLQLYLDHYQNIGHEQDYKGFFEYLWSQKIMRSQYRKGNIHMRRSECMLKIVHDKANSGAFYIEPSLCDDKEAISSLYEDEILGCDDAVSRYFIAHDVIEEIALLRLIEQRFAITSSNEEFFESVGCSLSIRRAFRVWLLGKIDSEPEQIWPLVCAVLSDNSISSHWRDESLISILTSTKANEFFNSIEPKLREEEFELFYRLIFLLRTACKEYDNTIANRFKGQHTTVMYLKYVFTQPRGHGWDFAINFIFRHRETLKNWRTIVPLLHDWTRKYKEGPTTRVAGKTALCKYKELTVDEHYWHGEGDVNKGLVKVILNSAGEIKEELTDHFKSVLNIGEPRSEMLVETLLTSLPDSFEVIKALPQCVEELAWFYWFVQPKDDEDPFRNRALELWRDFGLADFCCNRYFPASAFQTPVYGMLMLSHPIKTIDFIIKLTNHSVNAYVKSDRGEEVESILIRVEGVEFRQYIDDLLWNLYRGVSSGPHLLQSIHMALEKWLLELASKDDGAAIESICTYLLKNSLSASITSVVVSVILAYPEKTFNIAALLFRTPELFIYDTHRLVAEQDIKNLYLLAFSFLGNSDLRDERLKTCEDEFRKLSLEHIALNYQMFSYSDEDTGKKRRKILWSILDEHYANLPPEEDQDEHDRTWGTYLARMDIRKMEPKIESQEDNKMVVSFNPTIDPKLKEHNEQILAEIDDQNRFVPLLMWAKDRFMQENDNYLKYGKYNNNVQVAFEETKTVLEELGLDSNGNFKLFYKDLPAYSCAVMLRDFVESLDEKEIAFCREVIMSYIYALRDDNVIYQFNGASEPAIATLPVLAKLFPNDMNVLKEVYLGTLFIEGETSTFVKQSIQNLLWDTSTEDAWSILVGYIMLAERYEDVQEQKRKERDAVFIREPILAVKRKFISQNPDIFNSVIDNDLSIDDLEDIKMCRLSTIVTAIELLPIKLVGDKMKSFFVQALPTLSYAIFTDKEDFDYEVIQRIISKICPMILSSDKSDIDIYIKPFMDSFQFSEHSYLFLFYFIPDNAVASPK